MGEEGMAVASGRQKGRKAIKTFISNGEDFEMRVEFNRKPVALT